ncbi:MAG: acyltransferase [Sphingomonadaceae bacterium]|nr:acyltransferase [Sphingomonadaceae bacterium]MCP5391836.1 acyltransferase [Sphingomonadaceae bacterium]
MVANSALPYRPEIDGLRAVAVLAVVFYHAGLGPFSGGFAGVDVFFVISGYLICSLVLADLDSGRFSFLGFWERRARRIFPALVVMTLVSFALGLILLFPGDLARLGSSMAGVATFLSNFIFARHSGGYFDVASEFKPLMHTWSLAVEEQFYLIFPPLVFALWKWARRAILPLFALLLVTSLALAQWLVPASPDSAFFYTHLRAWELLAGVVIAIALRHHANRPAGWVSDMGAAAGLLLIFGTFFLLDNTAPFPAMIGVPVVLGAALVIVCADRGSLIGKILSWKPLVGIGLISYSLYLWHHPIFAYGRHLYIADPHGLLMPLLVLLSFPVAWLSWRYIEAPFRDRSRFGRLSIAIMSAAALGTILAAGVGVYFAGGLPQRFSPEVLSQLNVMEKPPTTTDHCKLVNATGAEMRAMVEDCYREGSTIYLVGDSHAEEIYLTLREAAEREGITLITMVRHACPPIFNVWHRQKPKECIELRQTAKALIEQYPAPLVLSSRWRMFATGKPFDNGDGGREMGPVLPMLSEDGPVVDPVGEMESSIVRWSEIAPSLVVIDQIPEAGWLVPRVLARRKQFGIEASPPLSTSYDLYKRENGDLIAMFDRLGKQDGIAVINTAPMVCSNQTGRCLNERGGTAYYYDDDHPSVTYSRMIVGEVMATPAIQSVVSNARAERP